MAFASEPRAKPATGRRRLERKSKPHHQGTKSEKEGNHKGPPKKHKPHHQGTKTPRKGSLPSGHRPAGKEARKGTKETRKARQTSPPRHQDTKKREFALRGLTLGAFLTVGVWLGDFAPTRCVTRSPDHFPASIVLRLGQRCG